MGRMFWRYTALFAVLSVAAGGLFWARSDEADWWAFVEYDERGPQPKFKAHWPEQLVVSAAVGAVVAAPATLLVGVAQWARRR